MTNGEKFIEIPRSGILISRNTYAIIAIGKKEVIMFNAKRKPSVLGILGAFFLCFYGALTEASCCCHRLSNHLLMRWQTTPAATAIKKEVIGSNTKHLPSVARFGSSNVYSIA